MLWTLCFAMAADLSELPGITAELDQVDTQIQDAQKWYATDGEKAEGLELQTSLREAAKRGREIHRKLSALQGGLEEAKKKERARLPEVVALRDRLGVQNSTRASALNLIDAGFAIDRIEAGETDAFVQLNNALYMAVTSHPAETRPKPDAWLAKPLDLAVAQEQWKLVFSWGTWCSNACEDKKLATPALEKVPERHGKDARWLNLGR